MLPRISRVLVLLIGPAFGVLAYPAHAAIDWAKVPGKDINVFYPATMSWERLFTPGRHSGQKKYREGKNCFSCHGDLDEDSIGRALVKAGGFIEPTPIPDKPPSFKAKIKTAHDAENIYIRVEFNPGEQPDAAMDKEFDTKVAMMLNDGGVAEMTRAGCWVSCHSNMASMPGVRENVTKYLAETRVTMTSSGGDQIKPTADIEKLRAAGNYIEYWQTHLKAGAVVSTVDGTILEKRAENPMPLVSATATKTNGVTAVTFSRKLAAGKPYKDILPGKTYTVGFSIHAGSTAQRFHYVSFERTLVLDAGKADFVAVARK